MSESHARSQFEEGLIRYVDLTGDQSSVALAGSAFRNLLPAFDANVRDTDVISLAFVGMVVRPDVRNTGLVAVLQDRVLVAWRKGVFKKAVLSDVLPRAEITSVTIGRSDRASLAGAVLLTIKTNTNSAQIALSKEGAAAGDSLRAAILPA